MMTIQDFVINTCVALCLLFVLPSPSSAQPPTIHGVNAEMNYKEVVSALHARSRHCNEPVEDVSSVIEHYQIRVFVHCWSDNTNTGDDSDISVKATDKSQLLSIRFNCRATRTCGLKVYEIISALKEADVLPDHIDSKVLMSGSSESFTFNDENGNSLSIYKLLGESSITIGVNEERYREFDF